MIQTFSKRNALGLGAFVAVLLLAASCSFVSNPNSGKGHVFVGAPRAGSSGAKSLAALKSPVKGGLVTKPRGNGSRNAIAPAVRAAARSRDLSASSDIEEMTYRVENLDNPSDSWSDSMDPEWPYLDLWLTPDANYRITIDIIPTDSAPGANTGVTRFGDSQEFYLDPYEDKYIDMYVHPTAMLVFNQFEINNIGPTQIQPFDAATDSWAVNRTLFSAGVTVSAEDKFFYGATGKLYYFSYADNRVYEWKNLKTPIIPATDVVLDGTSDLSGYLILAICPDPTTADNFWIVGTDGSAIKYFFRDTSGYYNPYDSPDIKSDLQDGNGGSTVFVTGLAIDTSWYDAFISFLSYNSSSDEYHSGYLEFYGDQIQTPGVNTILVSSGAADPSFSVLTDVAFDQGHLWTTASPMTSNASVGGIQSGWGTADIVRWDLDYYGIPYGGAYSPLATSYSGGASYNSPPLGMPGKFLGPFQGSRIYFNQFDSSSGSMTYEVSNSVDLNQWSVQEIWDIGGGA